MALPSVLPFQPIFNYPNNKLYQYEAYPVLLSCNFIVDSTNGNGLGIRSLKGSGIGNVFMHTTATPGLGNYAYLNPNPGTGIVLVQLQNQFSRLLGAFGGQGSPISGTPLTATVSNVTYTIVSLGTATAAQWLAAGVPPGMVPAVGLSFVAKQTATIGGSAVVEAPGASGYGHLELIGDPNVSLQNSNVYQNGGGQILFQAIVGTTPTAPANGTVISLNLYLSNSSIQIAGQ